MATAAKPKKAPGTAVAKAAPKAGGNIVSIQDMLRQQAAAVSEQVAPPTGSKIRATQDKHFLLPDGTKTPGPIDVVVVDFISTNKFYDTPFDSKNVTPPACFAIDRVPTRLTPSANSPVKQAETCAVCPMNQFGSSGDGKACRNTRLLAVLPPDADAETPLWTLEVSPTALKAFDGFVTSVARAHGVPPVGVIVSVDFDPSVTYARMRFSDARPNPNVAEHIGRQEEAGAMLAVEPDVSQYQASPKRGGAGGRRR